ncbi:F0F1 ATP synthase subunit gamma [Desulfosediminicola sp.]|uniref:F0F1 ATP synthase subunit gamma n=1 Tax=Desulfosediminicola sp. TaxID=2886825 RepID=UPI003AF23B73
MSKFRKVEYHIQQLRELQSIITSMKTLSQLELRKLTGRAEHYREIAGVLQEMVDDYMVNFPQPHPIAGDDLVMVIGSERGFCGPFNELLGEALLTGQASVKEKPWRVLAIGRKLCSHLDDRLPGYIPLAGAGTSEEIATVLPRIVTTVQRQMGEQKCTKLLVLSHGDEEGVVAVSHLLPPKPVQKEREKLIPPHLYLEQAVFFREFLSHYLYLSVIRLFTVSLMVENRYRVEHLGGAVHRLDERLQTLCTKARSLRQEEITEEIEMILLGSGTFDAGSSGF